MNNMAKLISVIFLIPLITIIGCSNEPPKETCHITTGGQEYHYPDFSKEDCSKEVQSLLDKGIIDAQLEWKITTE